MLKIWGRTNSSNVQKVLWTCADLGIPYERVDWGGKFGGNDDPAYRAMNPNGLVPTVQDGEIILWESNTIIRYLCNTRNGASLYPADAGKRSRVERWMDWQLSKLNTPMAAMLWGYYRTPPDKRDSAALEKCRSDAITLWHLLRRVPTAERGEVYDRMAALIQIPSSITRDGVVAGNATMLDNLWNSLDLGDTSWWRMWKSRTP